MKPCSIPFLSDFILVGTNFTNTYYGHTNVLVLRVLRQVRDRRHKTFKGSEYNQTETIHSNKQLNKAIITVLYVTVVIILAVS